MATPHSAVPTLIQKLLDDPDIAHNDMFRELMQAGLRDLINASSHRHHRCRPLRTHQRTQEPT